MRIVFASFPPHTFPSNSNVPCSLTLNFMTSFFIIIVTYTDIMCKDNLLSALTIEAFVHLFL